MNENSISKDSELAILAGIALPGNQRWEIEENLSELAQLAATSGVAVVDQVVQERQQIHSAHFLGKGKIDELKMMVKMHKAGTVIFDSDLMPAQMRNLEKMLETKIVDRSTLILDIFAKHARTRAAKTQVELAQLQYLLPRLTRQWTHLSRQVGGVGTKGPGETQLETDRRLIRRRIDTLQKELIKIDRQRQTRRKGRKHCFRASLVGYTNVGKSTIMNLLTGANVLVEDQLFATLDSTVRKVRLDNKHNILLSDTVGFIRKLPHHLIESFKSTLDEAVGADLLIHVIDVSHPSFSEQLNAVNQVLEEIGAKDKPVLMVFNKIDQLEEKTQLVALKRQYPNSLFISATRRIRTEQLEQALVHFMEKNLVETTLEIPMQHTWLLGKIYDRSIVETEEYTDTHVNLRFRSNIPDREIILQLLEKALRQNGKYRFEG